MPNPAMSDQEFIRICRTSRSLSEIHNKVKTDERSVRRRIKRLEQVYGPLAPSSQKLRLPEDSIQIEYKSQYTVAIFSDCHYWPGHITDAHSIFLQVVSDLKPKIIIGNGDLLDGYSISRHPKIMWEDGPSLSDEIQTLQDRLREIEQASPKSKLYRTIGNHCLRYESYLAQHAPQYKDIHGSSLDDHLPKWTSGWSVSLNNQTVVKHRWKVGHGAALANTRDSGVNMVTGHTHRLLARPYSNYRGEIVGIECGTLSDPTGPQYVYTEHNSLDWQSGFPILYVDGDELYYELVQVKNGKACFGGKWYKA